MSPFHVTPVLDLKLLLQAGQQDGLLHGQQSVYKAHGEYERFQLTNHKLDAYQ